MALPLLPLAIGGAGFLTKLLNRPKNMQYDFRFDPERVTASTYDYQADRNFLQGAKGLQTQGMDFITGRSEMQKGLLSEAYKTSFGLGDQQYNQANVTLAQQGVGGGGPSRAFKAITRSSAGEDYRKSALGIGTSFANLGLNALQSSLGAYGQMDTSRTQAGIFSARQRQAAALANAEAQNQARLYANQMGYEQAVGNQNARRAWQDSLGSSLFDIAGMAFTGASMGLPYGGGSGAGMTGGWTPEMASSFGGNSRAWRRSFGMNMNPNYGHNTRGYGGNWSDMELKENIELVNKSDSGINIYEFDYKDKSFGDGRYRGVMAQEVPQASFRHENGYLSVDYSKVDTDFERINH
jgi:hypothetical protein